MRRHLTTLFENSFGLTLTMVAAGCLLLQPAACNGSTRSHEPVAPGPQATARLVIHNATLRTMTDRNPAEPQSVIVQGKRIIEIVPSERAQLRESDHVVDAEGQFLTPGLADMHSHAYTDAEMARYLAYGVTTLRIMAGTASHLSRRDAVANGQRIAPTLVVASPIVDGDPAARPQVLSVSDEAQARDVVQSYHRAGYDQLKLYHNLSAEAFLAAVDAAHLLGMKAVGHAPVALSTQTAFEAGLDSSEHFAGILRAIQTQAPEFSNSTSSSEWSLVSGAAAVPSQAAPLAAIAQQHDVYLVPTLAMHRVLGASPEQWSTWAQDPRNSEISEGAREVWDWEAEGRQTMAPEVFELSASAWQNLLDTTRIVHQAGAELLVGTDYGMPYLYAGEGVHQELRIFVEAGLDPEAAFAAATSKPAKFLNQEGQFGSIVVGSRADLVLWQDDPLLSFDALGSITGVSVRGHWLDRARLDQLLETGVLPEVTPTEAPEVCLRPSAGQTAPIEDFNDGDAFINGDNRQGKWFNFDDGSGGQQTPTETAWTTVAGGVRGAALHVQGGGFTDWGSGVGVNFAWDTSTNRACGYDVSSWDGISFWAKGDVSGLSVGLPELDVVPTEEGGRCQGDCYGAHQASVDLDACWRQYAFSFSELVPPAWSSESGPLESQEVTGVLFTIPGGAPSARFELWLDEIEFFRGAKPSGTQNCNMDGAGGSP